MARILVIADLHLSSTRGFFWKNGRLACAAANRLAPDAVFVSGDLCINGSDDAAEIPFAAQALRGFDSPVHAIPGTRMSVTSRRARRPTRSSTRRACSAGSATDHARPAQAAVSAIGGRDRADRDVDQPRAARPLMRRPQAAPVRLVVSGPLHCHRDVVRDGVRYVWAPSPAFQVPAPPAGAVAVPGILAIELDGEAARVDLVEVPGLVAYDLAELEGHGRYACLRDMPPCPPLTRVRDVA